MDENDEEGAVVGAIYSAADATPVQNADKMHVGFKDGASVEYDRASHSLAINIPNGGALSISTSGANIQIDSSGNVKITAAGQIQLGSGGLAAVARVGDLVNCPAGSGRIVSGSGSTYSA
jgi:phage baseplate assembly protein V